MSQECGTSRRRRMGASIGGIVLAAVTLGTTTVGAAYNRVQIPVRWCVVQGSPAAANPNCACTPYTTWLVTARGFRASRSYANCRTLFRPAGNMGTSGIIPNVRTISDPCDPNVNPSCPGVPGDVYVDLSTNNLTEYFQVVAACRTAWNTPNSSAVGLVGVNIRRFVDAAGNPSNVAGLGGVPIFCSNASQAVAGQFAVTDDDFTLDYTNYPQAGGNVLGDICRPPITHPSTPPCLPQWFTDSPDTLTAHEMGHSLSLPHLAGTAMNATVPAPVTMTQGGFGQTANVCPAQPFPNPTSQCGTVRLQSLCHQNGTIVDPPPVVDEEPFVIGNVPTGHVDLDLAGLIDDGNTGSASVFWRAAGAFPANVNGVLYQFAIDLDQNPATGGDPSAVGIPVPLPGVELAGSVSVDVVSGTPGASASLYHWDGVGTFLPEPTLGSSASVLDVYVDEVAPGTSTSGPAQAAVSIDFDRNLLTGVPSTYTFRVRAFDPGSSAEDLPASAELYVESPSLPVCNLLPAEATPGQLVTVEGGDLVPSSPVVVWFDKGGAPFEVGTAMTDPSGFVSTAFTVPANADPGPHHVAILVDAPDSFSSHCVLDVQPPGGTPGETSTAGGGQMLVTSFDKGTGEVSISYAPACGASDHTAYTGNLASVSTYAWDQAVCSLGTSGTATFQPGAGSRFFVVVGNNGVVEGSYGLDGNGAERPEDTETVSICSHEQDLTLTCP